MFTLAVVLCILCASMTPTVSLLSLLALLLSATALEFTPSGKYAPSIVKCPRGDDAVTIRPATCLSEPEKAFRAKRAPNVINAMEKYLKRVNVPGFDVDECGGEPESRADRADTSASCATAQRRRLSSHFRSPAAVRAPRTSASACMMPWTTAIRKPSRPRRAA